MTVRKTTQLRQLLTSPQTEFLLEAHNGLSARIVEEAGFKGIWASGLAMSAAMGVRDNNEASWTQVLEVLELMSDATSIPILVDADTGYGNFNNARRLVRKLEQRDVAAMCIEDKLFPKTNSFINGEQQPLADVEEFAGKIRAAKEQVQEPGPGPLIPAPGVVSTDLEDAVVVASADTGRAARLAGVAGDMWRALVRRGGADRAAADLLAGYAVEEDRLRRDLHEFARELEAAGLLCRL